QHLIETRLAPYGFVVVTAPDPTNPLGQVKELAPSLIVIAVELPDKIGYALCNKAKKGPARDVPVILTTSSVPPSGFRSHRKLKVHADEYIDKRSATPDEIIAAIDRLVGLGEYVEPAVEAPAQPVEDAALAIEEEALPIEEMEVEELDVDEIEIAEDQGDGELSLEEQTSEPATFLRTASEVAGGGEPVLLGDDFEIDDLASEIDRAVDEVSGIHDMDDIERAV